MSILEWLVEKRIRKAIECGEFTDLPGMGRPLALDDDLLVPVEVRVANRILKNAGLLPPELLDRQELAALERDAWRAEDFDARVRAIQKASLLRAKIAADASAEQVAAQHEYFQRIVEKMTEGSKSCE